MHKRQLDLAKRERELLTLKLENYDLYVKKPAPETLHSFFSMRHVPDCQVERVWREKHLMSGVINVLSR